MGGYQGPATVRERALAIIERLPAKVGAHLYVVDFSEPRNEIEFAVRRGRPEESSGASLASYACTPRALISPLLGVFFGCDEPKPLTLDVDCRIVIAVVLRAATIA